MSRSKATEEQDSETEAQTDEALPEAEDAVGEAEAEEGDESKASGDGPEETAEVYKDRWVRLAAEFDNYRKRTAREREALIQSANEALIRDLLPVVDSVDRATSQGDTESEAFKTGLRMIMEEFPRVLEARGLKEIEAIGQKFDPNLHEALMQAPSDHEAGMVAEVMERGYRLGDKVLRPAKVVVSQGPPDEEDRSA